MKVMKMYPGQSMELYKADTSTVLERPLATEGIVCGFPSPAEDFMDQAIDLNQYIIKNPPATFFGRVTGDSMVNAGIHPGDILVIDRSLEFMDGKIAVCFVDGEFTVKRIKRERDCVWLVAENIDYPPIKVTADNELIIWGIVTHVIKHF